MRPNYITFLAKLTPWLAFLLLGLVCGCGQDGPKPGLHSAAGIADVTPTDADRLVDVDAITADAVPSPNCVVSADCKTPGESCVGGQCVLPLQCQSDKQCQNAEMVCDTSSALCVQCLTEGDCNKGELCKAHHCLFPPQPCVSTKECPKGLVCDKTLSGCVECLTANDCTKGQSCIETVCVAQACSPGAKQCSSPTELATCDASGQAWNKQECASDSACEAGACLPLVCAPGSKTCDGDAVATCSASGTRIATKTPCPSPLVCLGGECVSANCTANETKCENGKLLACKDDGSGWQSLDCDPGQVCASGLCKPKACDPGQPFCKGTELHQCDMTGASATLVMNCAAIQKEPSTCLAGKCVAASCQAGSTQCADAATLATCKPDGTAYVTTACGAGKGCSGGKCLAQTCKPGESVCQGATVVTCDASGTKTSQTADCSATKQACVLGKCSPLACQPGTTSCQGASVGTCKSDGSGWELKACPADQACQAGACKPALVCVAGAKQCSGTKLLMCAPDGTKWTETSCDDNNACTQDSCLVTTGCKFTNLADGTVCGANGTCTAGVCQDQAKCAPGAKQCFGGKLLSCNSNGTAWLESSCDDGNSCTSDSCDPTVGCVNAKAIDGTPCGAPNICAAGKCVATCTAGTIMATYEGWSDEQAQFLSILALADGGAIAVGVKKDLSLGKEDAIASRFDGAGKELWSKTLGGKELDQFTGVFAAGSDVIAVGMSGSKLPGVWSVWWVRLDFAGTVLSEGTAANLPFSPITFGLPSGDRALITGYPGTPWNYTVLSTAGTVGPSTELGCLGCEIKAGAQLTSGNLLFVGISGQNSFAWSAGAGGPISGSTPLATAMGIAAGPANSAIAVGQMKSAPAASRIDASGNTLWSKSLPVPAGTVGSLWSVTPAGANFVATGETAPQGGLNTSVFYVSLNADGTTNYMGTAPAVVPNGTNYRSTAVSVSQPGAAWMAGFVKKSGGIAKFAVKVCVP